MKVLNYGSLNFDFVYAVDHIVAPGETLSSFRLEQHFGGKGLNQSIALARAGVPVFHAGLVGEDGQAFLDLCQKSGVDTRYIGSTPGKSGHAIIQVDKNAQNCILLFGGSNQLQTKEYIDSVLANFEKGDILLLQNEVNLLPYLIDKAAEIGMTIVLNPSPFDEKISACDLGKVGIFLLNEVEGAQLTGKSDPEQITQAIRALYPGAIVVLTLGEAGSVYDDGKAAVRQPIFKVKAVDTTAAGDTFTGYFIYSLVQGMPASEGLALAAKASAIAVSREGATDSIPTLAEVQAASL